MTKSYSFMKYICAGLIVMIVLTFSPINSQVPLKNTYGQSYKVKKGDTTTYKYSIVINPNGENTFPFSMRLENDTLALFNITQGQLFTIKVVDVFPNNTILTQQIMKPHGIGELISKPYLFSIPRWPPPAYF